MNLYELRDATDSAIWTGRRPPTQREIDAALVEHFGERARTVTVQLHRNADAGVTVAHDDYDGPADDPDAWSGGFAENH